MPKSRSPPPLQPQSPPPSRTSSYQFPSPRPQPLIQLIAAPGSLRDLLLQHSRTRLYIHPLQWTAQHLTLLTCIVNNEYEHELIVQPNNSNKNIVVPIRVLADLWSLQRNERLTCRNMLARRIMRNLGNEIFPRCKIGPSNLILQYNQRHICKFRLPLVAYQNCAPVWAYIDSTWLDELHQKARPAEDIYVARVKRAALQSSSPIIPFFVAILIAMAQQTYLQQQTQILLQQQVILYFVDHPRQISSSGNRVELQSRMYQYTANISQKYLQKFDHPYDAFEAELVYSRIIPLHVDTSETLYCAVQDSETMPLDDTTHKGKRKVLGELNRNEVGKRTKMMVNMK